MKIIKIKVFLNSFKNVLIILKTIMSNILNDKLTAMGITSVKAGEICKYLIS